MDSVLGGNKDGENSGGEADSNKYQKFAVMCRHKVIRNNSTYPLL
jgi:hypothetical protein